MLQVKNVTARLADHIQCVDLNFHVEKGETYGILGNGSAGKTGLIQLLSGIRPLESGTIQADHFQVHRHLRRAQQHLGVLSRKLALFPSMTAEENLLFWGRLYHLPIHSFRDRVNTVLGLVGYEENRQAAIADLSALNQKRIHLAAALLHEPKLLLLDQPTDDMTAAERNDFMLLMQQLQQTGLTIVYATDKVDEIQQVANRAAILDEGQIVAEGTVDELRSLLRGQSQIIIRCHPLRLLIRRIEEAAIVHTVDLEKNEVRLWTTKPKELLAYIFSAWHQEGIVTESVRVVEPTLAGVYLHLTGKSLDT